MGHLYHGYVSHNQRVFGFFIQGNLQKLDMTECFFCLSSNHAAVHPEYINQLSLISCHILPLNIIMNGSVQQPYIYHSTLIPINPLGVGSAVQQTTSKLFVVGNRKLAF